MAYKFYNMILTKILKMKFFWVIFHLNACSLTNKMVEFTTFVSILNHKFTVISVTET